MTGTINIIKEVSITKLTYRYQGNKLFMVKGNTKEFTTKIHTELIKYYSTFHFFITDN